MKKRLLSIISSIAITATSLTALTANGMVYTDFNLDEYQVLEEDNFLYKEVEKVPKGLNESIRTTYYKIDDEHCLDIVHADFMPAHMNISIKSTVTADELNTIFSKICNGIEIVKTGEKGDYINYQFKTKNEKGEYCEFTVAELKEIYNIIQNNDNYNYGTSFIYNKPYYSYTPIYFGYLTRFYCVDSDSEVLEKYIKENNINAELEIEFDNTKFDIIRVVPNYEISIEEHLKLSQQIQSDTGLKSNVYIPEEENVVTGKKLTISGYLNGDANKDEKLTLADSVAVLQSIANPDKYALSMEGEFNAEVDGEDGITVNDALILRQWGMENTKGN